MIKYCCTQSSSTRFPRRAEGSITSARQKAAGKKNPRRGPVLKEQVWASSLSVDEGLHFMLCLRVSISVGKDDFADEAGGKGPLNLDSG